MLKYTQFVSCGNYFKCTINFVYSAMFINVKLKLLIVGGSFLLSKWIIQPICSKRRIYSRRIKCIDEWRRKSSLFSHEWREKHHTAGSTVSSRVQTCQTVGVNKLARVAIICQICVIRITWREFASIHIRALTLYVFFTKKLLNVELKGRTQVKISAPLNYKIDIIRRALMVSTKVRWLKIQCLWKNRMQNKVS